MLEDVWNGVIEFIRTRCTKSSEIFWFYGSYNLLYDCSFYTVDLAEESCGFIMLISSLRNLILRPASTRSSRPGFSGRSYGSAAGTRVWYVFGLQTNPRCPWAPPPSSVWTEPALSRTSASRVISDAVVGSPMIRGHYWLFYLRDM